MTKLIIHLLKISSTSFSCKSKFGTQELRSNKSSNTHQSLMELFSTLDLTPHRINFSWVTQLKSSIYCNTQSVCHEWLLRPNWALGALQPIKLFGETPPKQWQSRDTFLWVSWMNPSLWMVWVQNHPKQIRIFKSKF